MQHDDECNCNAIAAPRHAGRCAGLRVSGLLLAFLPGSLSALVGFSWPNLLLAAGLGLIVYALWLLFSVRRPVVNLWAGRAAVVLNGLWVAGSIALLVGRRSCSTRSDSGSFGIVAAVVADFALVPLDAPAPLAAA